MAKLIRKIRQLIGLASKSGTGTDTATSGSLEAAWTLPAMDEVLDDRVIMKLMQMIERTDELEYSCEETFAVLDEYVDLATKNDNAAALMPLVKRHIDLCVDCRDEFQTLLRVLESDASAPAQ